ncbi:nitroreductase family protein [Candidatus Methylocalor cossyra]|uniref:Nitroreductase family protein n=1 Tax=Candidatus Methylocalor cossyra TaxID=3108543 RepID=A0ABM9NIC7_9GAMM
MTHSRTPEHDIHPLFVARWSPRAFAEVEIPEGELLRFFEAARWAPSSYNSQPWRFLYARRGTEHWPTFLDLLMEFNRVWASRAAALVILLSKAHFIPPGKTEPITTGSQSFDAGAAWAQFALQASLSGWHTHAMGGFDRHKARAVLGIPEDYHPETAIAVGKLGDPGLLPEPLRAREAPSSRRPIAELIAEGRFRFRD